MVEGQQHLGPYRIVHRLGVGGMAETFEAVRIDPSGFEHRVCLKRVLPAFRSDAAFVERFEREALLAARLRHSNVVGVLDFGAEGGVPYMALELVDGPDLRTFLGHVPDRRLPVGVALLVASDVAMALAYAHAPEAGAPGVVHRDVSASNVLLGRSGDVKLADFGIAKAMDGAGATASGEVRGKIPYMSPEHMRGQPVDGRSDLFSVGVLLFEMLAGERPFDGAHDVETMTRILADERKRLEDLAPGIPPAVVAIVDRLLEGRIDDRFPSADALLAAIEAAGVDPRERIALSEAVEETLGGVATRGHLTAGSVPPAAPASVGFTVELEIEPAEDAPREATPTPATTPVPNRRPERPRHVGPALLAFGLGTIAVGAAVSLRSSSPDAELAARVTKSARTKREERAPITMASVVAVTSPSSHPSPRTASPVPAQDAPEAPEPSEPDLDSAREGAAGRLRVTVVPWGRVWVDGRAVGRAPRTLVLARGEHLVEAGFEHPTASRRIRVLDERVAQVQFELE